MKTMQTVLACLLSFLGNGMADEVKRVQISQREKLEFTGRAIQPDAKREHNTTGYALFEGKIYRAVTKVPHVILESGTLTIDGKAVALDVSGIGDPWVSGNPLHRRFVRLDRTNEKDGEIRLSVCFAKGGAEDFVVEWVIMGGKSLRISITDCGDTYPDWVKPPDKDEK